MPEPRYPAVRRGRRTVLPLWSLTTAGACAPQFAVALTLADHNGDIPVTKATLRKALALGLNLDWLAAKFGVPIGAEWDTMIGALNVARVKRDATIKAAVDRCDKVHRELRCARDKEASIALVLEGNPHPWSTEWLEIVNQVYAPYTERFDVVSDAHKTETNAAWSTYLEARQTAGRIYHETVGAAVLAYLQGK